MRLNSRTGTEGSPVTCDRPLVTFMNKGPWVKWVITDGYGLCTKARPSLCRLRCDQAGMVEQNSAHTVWLSDVMHIKPNGHVWETLYCLFTVVNKQYKVSQTHYTPALDSGQCRTLPIHRLYSIHWLETWWIGPRLVGWPQHWLWAISPASVVNSHPKWRREVTHRQ